MIDRYRQFDREREKERKREREKGIRIFIHFTDAFPQNCIGLISRRKYLISDYRCKRSMYIKKEKKDKKKEKNHDPVTL